MSWKACWDVESIQGYNFIRGDVAEIDPRFLDALHVEPALKMRGVPERGLDDAPFMEASQGDLLRAISEPGDGKTNRFIALTGEPGTGKSHLLHWVYRRLTDDCPNWLEVRYVPKSCTNLREIVRTILGPPDCEELEALHESVGLAASLESVTESEMVLKLAQKLELVLEFDHHLDIDAEFGDHERAAATDLLGTAGRGLPALVTLPPVKDALRSEGSVLNRCIRGLIDSRADDPPGVGSDVSFTTEDLATLVRTAERDGAEFTADLIQNPDLTVAILNHALDVARGMTVDLSTETLAEALRRLRQLLREREEGKELLVMFEDFSDAKGIQATLLREFEVAPLEDGNLERCPVRFAIAVTNRPYRGMRESYLSRARTWEGSAEFNLDQEATYSQDRIEELFGRYMNLARLGPQTVLDAEGGTVQSKCGSCDLQIRCHEAFGSQSGFGLFPLNAQTILRLAFPGSEGTRFNPRRFLLEAAVRPTLRDAPPQLERRVFPSGSPDSYPTRQLGAKKDSTLDEEEQAALKAATDALSRDGAEPTDDEQRRLDNIVRWWKPAGEPGKIMAEALTFPVLLVADHHPEDLRGSDGGVPEPIDEKKPPEPTPPPVGRRVDPRLADITEWADSEAGIELPGNVRGPIQRAVWDVITALHVWPEILNESPAVWGSAGDAGKASPVERFGMALGVEGGANFYVRAVGLDRTGATMVNFERRPEPVETLKAIVRLEKADQFGLSRVEQLQDLARVEAFKIDTAERLRERCEGERKKIMEEHSGALRRSWWFTNASAEASSGSRDAALDLREQTPPASECGADWVDLVSSQQEDHLTAARAIARYAGRSQGEDNDPATTVLDPRGDDLGADPADPSLEAVRDLLAARIERLEERKRALHELVGGADLSEVARAAGGLSEAMTHAHGAANPIIHDLCKAASDQDSRDAVAAIANAHLDGQPTDLGLAIRSVRQLDRHETAASELRYLLEQAVLVLSSSSMQSATDLAEVKEAAAAAAECVELTLNLVAEKAAALQ